MKNLIKTTVGNFPFGFVYTPSDFPIDLNEQASVNLIFNNRVASGEIRCLSKKIIGKYKIITKKINQKPKNEL